MLDQGKASRPGEGKRSKGRPPNLTYVARKMVLTMGSTAASGDELGDGSGTVITSKRVLTGADTITVVQQLDECTSRTGYRVSARNVGSQ
jgi:hypothetical protein